MKALLLLALFSLPLAYASNSERLKNLGEVRSFAFGSCNKQYFVQPLWSQLMKEAPDLFIFGGDNVYANAYDPEKIREAYDRQNSNTDYVLFKSMTPIIGTWDDHDYTKDNANEIGRAHV